MSINIILKKYTNYDTEDLDHFLNLYGPHKPNTTVEWKGSDQLKQFEKYKLTDPERFEYWKDKSIKYKYNNLGFRSNFDFEPGMEGILCLGCSFTEGIGLPLDYVWHTHLSNHLNEKCFNLGSGGTGLDTSFRLLLAAVEYGLQFDKVFVLAPPVARYEQFVKDNNLIKYFFRDNNINDIHMQVTATMVDGYWSKDTKNTKIPRFFNSLAFGSSLQMYIYNARIILAMDSYCKMVGAKLHFLTHSFLNSAEFKGHAEKIPIPNVPNMPSRDGHWSANMQYFTFAQFLKEYPTLKQLDNESNLWRKYTI